MDRSKLIREIRKKQSFLCVGLDTDIDRIPKQLQKEKDPIFTFNKAIIDATANYCVAYKPNLAFYEAMGSKGMESLEKTMEYIPKDFFTIADAKRGDIGNTAASYAKTFFQTYNFDSVTIAPYMGKDSVLPFLEHKGKWTIILGLTSNPGSADFQLLQLEKGAYLFEEVIKTSAKWGNIENTMFVVGATNSASFANIRKLIPDHFLLVPGVGAQGGSLEEVCKYGLNEDVGLLVNSSRGILYASEGTDFREAAKKEAKKLQAQMAEILGKM